MAERIKGVGGSRAMLAALIFLLLPASVEAKDLPFKISFAFSIAGQGADTYSTGWCVGRGFHEANPILRPLEDNKYALGAVKAGIGATGAIAAYQLHKKGHTKLGILTNLAMGSLGFYLASRNFRTCI